MPVQDQPCHLASGEDVRLGRRLPGLDGGWVQIRGKHAQHRVKVRQAIVYVGHLSFGFQQPAGNFGAFADQSGDDVRFSYESSCDEVGYRRVV
jgi:hypothetical protein